MKSADEVSDEDSQARRLVRLMKHGPGHPLMLIGTDPGKLADFMRLHLTAHFEAAGYIPVLADLGNSSRTFFEYLNEALALVSAVDITSADQGQLEYQIGQSLDTIHKQSGRPVTLLLNGFPERLADADIEDAVASVRATLTVRASWLHVIFGSTDQSAVRRLLRNPEAPMFQFATSLRFPGLTMM